MTMVREPTKNDLIIMVQWQAGELTTVQAAQRMGLDILTVRTMLLDVLAVQPAKDVESVAPEPHDRAVP